MAHPHSSSRHLQAKKRGRLGKTISCRSYRAGEKSRDIAWGPTIYNALLRMAPEAGPNDFKTGAETYRGALSILPSDLRIKVHKRLEKVFVLFIIDSSDSMGARRRLAVAKGAVLGLLRRAYQQRHAVAVITFGESSARLTLRPTSSVFLARRSLRVLRPEGATPMAAGIRKGIQVLHTIDTRREYSSKIVVILSDGEANVPLHRGADPQQEVLQLVKKMKTLATQMIFIDSKRKLPGRRSEMYGMAETARGKYFSPDELTTGTILRAVNQAE